MNVKKLIDDAKRFLSIKSITEEEIEKELEIKKVVSFLVVFATTTLTIMNLLNNYLLMALSTSILTISFLVCISLCSNKDNIKIINVIMSITIIVVFSYYAISGQNEGFAILWISLVPIISIIVINIRSGIYLSIYFQLLLMIIFYTPIRDLISSNYTETFKTRYPLLFFVSFSLSIYVTTRDEEYKNNLKNALKFDKLTKLPNRDIYDETISHLDPSNINLFLIKIDGLKMVNSEYGHETGNRLIKYAADYIQSIFMDKYVVYRISGSSFAVIITDNDVDYEKQVAKFNFTYKNEVINGVSLLSSVTSIDETNSKTFKELECICINKIDDIINAK